jgi:hypothetical protein
MKSYVDEHLELQTFSAAIGETIDGTADRPDDIFECVDALSELSRSQFTAKFISSELEKSVENDVYQLRNPIVTGPGFVLAFEMTGARYTGSQMLWGSPRHQLLCIASERSVCASLYERQIVGPEDVFASEEPLQFRYCRKWARGETIGVRANRDFLCGEGDQASLTLVLSSRLVSNFRWLYRSDTLLPCALYPARTSGRKLELALVLAGNLLTADALPVVSRFLNHEEFCVRWTAIETILSLDHAAGLCALNRAVNDVHPEVRRRALDAINLIGEGVANG